MFDARRSVPDEVDWIDVSARRPCPVCGERAGCRTHADASFAGCSRRPSDWPLTNGLWLHRVSVQVILPARSDANRDATSTTVADAVTQSVTQQAASRSQLPPPHERSGRA